jgi:hypothetical protein
MSRVGLCALFLGLLACSGQQSESIENPMDVSATDAGGAEEPPPPPRPDAGVVTITQPAPRRVSLEAAGGEARSEHHRLRFRVAAPIVVAGATRASTSPKLRKNP